jgi:diaminohydroxyphosphoribosylaminopyrimidine deaminase / 5-amino-6-(5-phosphoribosylamino)uracil reductase
VIIGGGTLRAEKLSLSLDADDPRPRPLAVVLTNSGDVPLERNLVRDPRQDVLVLLSEGAREDAERDLRRLAEIRRVRGAGATIDLAEALRVLKTEYGIGTLLCEGGPILARALISSDLADELFLTLAPVIVGQTYTPTRMDAPQRPPLKTNALHQELRLLSARPVGDELFTRYALNPRERQT